MTAIVGQTQTGQFIISVDGVRVAPSVGPTVMVQIDDVDAPGVTVTLTATALDGVYDYDFVVPDNVGQVLSLEMTATLPSSQVVNAEEIFGTIQAAGDPLVQFTNGLTVSYVTVAEADAYASAYLNAAWGALDLASKEAYLSRAAVYLDKSYDWKGSIVSTDQSLAWPRSGVVDAQGRSIDESTIPQAVKDAQVELAFLAMTNGGTLVQNQTERNISRVAAGSVSVSFDGPALVDEEDRFRTIDRLLYGLLNTRDRLDDESDYTFQIRSVG